MLGDKLGVTYHIDENFADGRNPQDSEITLLQKGEKTSDGIGMQDIRLMAGEGKLTKKTVLQALAVIRKQRRERKNSKQGVTEARGLAPVNPYVELMQSLGWFMSMNTAKIQQDAVDSAAQQELKIMQQQFNKPIINGKSFAEILGDNTMLKHPKVAPALLKFAYDILGYIEPRIKRYIRPELQAKWMMSLSKLKDQYRAAVQFTSGQQGVAENFADGRNPQDKGDSARHGIRKGMTIAQLKKIRSSDSASPRKKQLAHWQINMRQGRKK
jgi:hypothetical protein